VAASRPSTRYNENLQLGNQATITLLHDRLFGTLY
jgi:hypothetical protein